MKSVWHQSFVNLPPIQEAGKPIQFRVPWLKFIQLWHITLPHEDNPFSMSKNLGKPDEWNDPNRKLVLTQNTESYMVRDSESEEFRTVFLVTLNNSGGTARIELFDPKYIGQSENFYLEVTK